MEERKATVYLHEMICKVKPINNFGRPNVNLYEILNSILKDGITRFQIPSSDTTIVIDFLDYNEEYIFGSIGKIVNMNEKENTRLVDPETGLPIEEDSKEYFFEFYSYFYIDLVISKVANFKKTDAPAFRGYLANWFNSNYDFFIKIDFPEIYKEKADINKYNKISKFRYKFSPKKDVSGRVYSIGKLEKIDENLYSSVTVELNVVQDVPPKNVWDEEEYSSYDYDEFKVYGENENGISEVADLVKGTLVYKIKIALPETQEELISLIKNELRRLLSSQN